MRLALAAAVVVPVVLAAAAAAAAEALEDCRDAAVAHDGDVDAVNHDWQAPLGGEANDGDHDDQEDQDNVVARCPSELSKQVTSPPGAPISRAARTSRPGRVPGLG